MGNYAFRNMEALSDVKLNADIERERERETSFVDDVQGAMNYVMKF